MTAAPTGRISYYGNVTASSTSNVTRELVDVFGRIRGDEYRQKTTACRIAWRKARDRYAAGDIAGFKQIKEGTYAEAKRRLPLVTFAGVFPGKRETTSEFIPSGFIMLDFDGDKVTGMTPAAAADLREQLRDDPHIVGAFMSPGKGVRGVLRIDIGNDAELKQAWPALQTRYGGQLDEACKDITRLSFLAHDPDAWIRDTWPLPFDWRQPGEPFLEPLPKSSGIVFSDQPTDHLQSGWPDPPAVPATLQRSPAPASTQATSEAAAECIQHIRNKIAMGARMAAFDPAQSRHGYMRSACVVAHRYVIAGQITEDVARAAVLDAYVGKDGVFPGVELRREDAERTFDGWARDRARGSGPLYPKSAPATATMPSVDDIQRDGLENLIESLYRPWWDNEPDALPAVLTFAGEVEVGHAGSITTAVASHSAGKSTVSTAIWAAYYNEPGDNVDTLGFKVTRPEGKPVALYFDSEQAQRESWQAWRRAMNRSKFTAEQTAMFNTYLNCSHYASNMERQAVLFAMLEDYVGDMCGLVVIDGIADFMGNVLNPDETDAFIQRLRRVASENNICVVATIHQNKGAEAVNPRGHLGSDLLRRSSNVLYLSKDRNAGKHTITVEKARAGRSGVKWEFTYDEETGAHISTGQPVAQSVAYTGLVMLMREKLTAGVTYATSDLRAIIESLEPEITAKEHHARNKFCDRVIKQSVAEGIIEKPFGSRGKYRISSPSADDLLPF